MAHLFVVTEARELWTNKFLVDMRRRRYPMKTKSGISMFEPNVREMHFYDITVPEDSLPTLLDDLAPFMNSDVSWNPVFIKKRVYWIMKLIRRFLGLRPVTGTFKPNNEVRKDWVNIAVIGWKKDRYDEETGMELI